MSFQAPFNPMGLMEANMQADLYRQQQQQRYAQDIMGALGDIAGAYQQHETMKAGVKSGEQMLKMFGPQLGIDSKLLSSPEYKAMGIRGQAMLHSNIWGSLGSLSQLRMAESRQQQAIQMPGIRAAATGMQNQAAQGGPTQMAFPASINPDVIP